MLNLYAHIPDIKQLLKLGRTLGAIDKDLADDLDKVILLVLDLEASDDLEDVHCSLPGHGDAASVDERDDELQERRGDVRHGNLILTRLRESGGGKQCLEIVRVEGEDKLVTRQGNVLRHQLDISHVSFLTELLHLKTSIQIHSHDDKFVTRTNTC